MVDIAKDKGYKRVCVTTDDVNTPSIKMLKNLGFKKFSANSQIQKITRERNSESSQYYLDL